MEELLNIPEPTQYVNDNFMFIDSYNYKDVKSKLYGFYIGNDALLVNTPRDELLDKDNGGNFLNVIRQKDQIIIQQDFFGSYGLFLFQKDDYFAISNSSLFLVYHIADKYKLTINKGFIDFVSSTKEYMPYLMETTYINEIRQLPPNCNIYISTKNGELDIDKPVYEISSLPLDSKKAFNIIDTWHNKYHNLLKSLLNDDYNIRMHLTGGMDSRTALSIFFDPDDLNLRNFTLTCKTDNESKVHIEDLEIAEKISSFYGIPLNKTQNEEENYRIDNNEAFSDYFYMNFLYVLTFVIRQFYYYPRPRIYFTGFGGEVLRKYWSGDWNNLARKFYRFPIFKDYDFKSDLKNLYMEEFKKIDKLVDNPLPPLDKIYLLTRQRYHFCRSTLDGLLHNILSISPLMEPALLKIQHSSSETSSELLYATIMSRFMPKLDAWAFQGGREINASTWEEAHRLNRKYAYAPKSQAGMSLSFNTYGKPKAASGQEISANRIYSNSLKSEELENFIKTNYGEDVYDYFYQEGPEKDQEKLRMLNAIYEFYLLCSFLNYEKISTFIPFKLKADYISNDIYSRIFSLLSSAQIIVKANSKNGAPSLELIRGKENLSKLITPAWLQSKNQSGFVLEANRINIPLEFEIKIEDECNLELSFTREGDRTKDQDYELFIDYLQIEVEEKLLDDNDNIISSVNKVSNYAVLPVCKRQPYKLSFPVSGRSIILIRVAFKPHDYDLTDFIKAFLELHKKFSHESLYIKS